MIKLKKINILTLNYKPYIREKPFTHAHIDTHTIYIYIYTYTHIYMHIHIHTCACTHMQSCNTYTRGWVLGIGLVLCILDRELPARFASLPGV